MADHTEWPLVLSPKGHTLIDAIDPETPGEPYRIANCWSGPFAPAQRIAVANARRIVAAWNTVRGIRTEHIDLVDSLVREARILAAHCGKCGATGRMGEGRCYVCGPMRGILEKIGEGGRDG